MWTLIAIGIASGATALWVVQKTTDREAVPRSRKKIRAHLLELRLFADEPALIWRAQMNLVRESLRFCKLMWRPVLILAPPMTWLFIQLDRVYGWAPLPVGCPAVVTVQMNRPPGAEDASALLTAPDGIEVETPAVRVVREKQISWRIRPARE